MVYRDLWDDMEKGFAEIQDEAFGNKSPKDKTFLDVADEEALDLISEFDEEFDF